MPIDIKCAFLIELAEPLVEIVKNHTNCFSSLNPGNRGTTLKICLEELKKNMAKIFSKMSCRTVVKTFYQLWSIAEFE